MLTQATRSQVQTLLDHLQEQPNAPAITFLATGADPIVITRAEFLERVQQVGGSLQQVGLAPRDLVIVAYSDMLSSIFAFWGALWIGAIPSMFTTLTEKLDRDIYIESMAQLVSHADAKAILTDEEFIPLLSGTCPIYSTLPAADVLPGQYHADPEAIAFLQHSSGTTGLQKGVALTHRAVLNQLASYADALHLNTQDVIVSWLPLYHDMGLIAGFLQPLIQAVPLVLMSPFDWVKHPAMLLQAIDTYKGTLCWLPNFAYNHCARRIRQRDTENISLASMRMFINCSEPVHASSHTLFAERFAKNGITLAHLGVSYAMAENTFAVTQTPPGQPARLDQIDAAAMQQSRQAIPVSENGLIQVSCGQPIDGVQIKVLDEQQQPLPERHIGEIAIHSDFMLTGYYHRPDLNANLFLEGWYRTGDMGYVADGEVYVIGRKKDLIINAGKNVYPQDIEAIVNTITGVHPGRAVAFGVYDEREGTELIGVVAEVDMADPAELERIEGDIRQRVSQQGGVTATYVHLVDDRWLIKTSSGKIARAANRDKWRAECL